MQIAIAMSGWLALTSLATVAMVAAAGDADQFTAVKKECAPQLGGLAPCLPYVSGSGDAKAPTMDCCTNLKQVLTANKKCVCLLVKYRNEPGLGVKIDVDLALGLPAVCHATPIYNCPALLNLAPNSPDAKVFTDFYQAHNSTTAATAPSTSLTVTGSKASDGSPSISERRLGARQVIQAIFVLFFTLS